MPVVTSVELCSRSRAFSSALGERFVMDLGWEDYENPAEDRYQLYRNRAEGHNTLVINPSAGYDQVRDTVSKIAAFGSIITNFPLQSEQAVKSVSKS